MPSFRRMVASRLDLYILRLLVAPLGFVLAAILVAQLLERVLRLFDLVGASGAPLSAVFTMTANLVPHYLGLALPAAFTAAMFLALARLSDESELDAMLAAGRSLARVAMPYFVLSVALSGFSFYLFGYLQPLSRYAYHAAAHDALHTQWDARVEDNRLVSAGGGFKLSADSVGPDGRRLHGVFVVRRTEAAEEVTTARSGRLVPAPDGRRVLLQLDEGLVLREDKRGNVSLARFATAVIDADFTPAPPPFRDRGGSVREMTLPELWRGMHGAPTPLPQSKLAGEFHGRLARSLVLPLLPLLAVPMAIAAKRARRTAGAVLVFLSLLGLNHGLQFGESLAESGRAGALPAVWTPLLLFAVLCLWLFRSSLAWPGDNPVTGAVLAVENAFVSLRRRPCGPRP